MQASRTGPYSEALDAFRGARLAACLRATRGHEAAPARLLRARAFLRLDRPADARSALRDLYLDNDVVRGEVAMLQAAAAVCLGDHVAAGRLFLTARAYVFSSDAPALEAELEYHSAVAAFARADLRQAFAACRRLLHVPPSSGTEPYVIPLRHLRASAFELLGRVRAARGNYGAQVPFAFKALDEFRRSDVRDAFQEAQHVANAAILVRDLALDAHAAALWPQVHALGWTAETAGLCFEARGALGWCAALRGDFVGAFRAFRRTGEALTPAQEIALGADRALLAFELEQRIVAAEEIGHALDLAERCVWERVPDDDAPILVRLAQAAALLEPARARVALQMYADVRAARAPLQPAHVDERLHAQEAFAEGVVARANGDVPLALQRLRTAFGCWTRIGYAWPAARAAIELVELGAGDGYREYLRRELALRPASWFAKRAARAVRSAESKPLNEASPQRRTLTDAPTL